MVEHAPENTLAKRGALERLLHFLGRAPFSVSMLVSGRVSAMNGDHGRTVLNHWLLAFHVSGIMNGCRVVFVYVCVSVFVPPLNFTGNFTFKAWGTGADLPILSNEAMASQRKHLGMLKCVPAACDIIII